MSEHAKKSTGELFERLVDVVHKLRSPDGCPWDREQTHRSLRPYIIEEIYELIDSIDDNDIAAMREELGDVLLHVIFHSDIRAQTGDFRIDDVIETIILKLIRRHPHVFGDVDVSGSDEVLQNWENIKLSERMEKHNEASLLDGVPRAMSALLIAQRMQEKASRIGFDWSEIEDVWKKVKEEIRELEEIMHSSDYAKIEGEIGDAIFAIVNLARFLDISAEMALRRTNTKFSKRFRYIEEKLRERDVQNPTLQQMDSLWEEAKERMKADD